MWMQEFICFFLLLLTKHLNKIDDGEWNHWRKTTTKCCYLFSSLLASDQNKFGTKTFAIFSHWYQWRSLRTQVHEFVDITLSSHQVCPPYSSIVVFFVFLFLLLHSCLKIFSPRVVSYLPYKSSESFLKKKIESNAPFRDRVIVLVNVVVVFRWCCCFAHGCDFPPSGVRGNSKLARKMGSIHPLFTASLDTNFWNFRHTCFHFSYQALHVHTMYSLYYTNLWSDIHL